MTLFLFHLLLSAVWALFLPFSLVKGFCIGFVVQYLLLVMVRPVFPNRGYLIKLWSAVWFIPYFTTLYCRFIWRSMWHLISPMKGKYKSKELIVDTALSPSQRLVISSIASLIPGIIVVQVSDKSIILYTICFSTTTESALRQFEKDLIMPIVRFIS